MMNPIARDAANWVIFWVLLLSSAVCQALPNLQVTNIQLLSDAVIPGKTLRVSWEVRNTSTVDRAQGTWHDHVLLSNDGQTGTDLFLYQYGYFTALEPGQYVTLEHSITVPENTALGVYWIVVHTDAEGDLPESQEEDNAAIQGPLSVTRPNLAVTGIDLSMTPTEPGDAFRITWYVTNASAEVTAQDSWSDDLYLTSSHPVFQPLLLNRYNLWASLGPGNTYHEQRSARLPEDLWAGEYWIVARTDVDNRMVETDETDNTRKYGPILLGGAEPPLLPLMWWPLVPILAVLGLWGRKNSTRNKS